ncbi:MAG: cytidine/deoxycytidylate deaminase family protein [Symbiobacteriaceae bacterium]|nr:cytidine/deoxycytidylate deaminase family protein [Symbiobacteriaceae bacterium]
MRSRPDWEDYFMELADIAAKRSTCLRRQMGALLVRDRRVLSTGYNGPPRGLAHCDEVGCLREQMGVPSGERAELCRAVHAEQNAVILAALGGISPEGAEVFVTHFPCAICAKILINAGITKITYREGYPDQLSADLLAEAGITLVCVAPSVE